MYEFKKVTYTPEIPHGIYILGADIGGTNSNFGFFQVVDSTRILRFSWHYKSQKIKIFTELVRDMFAQVKQHYDITIEYACFAAAGVVTPEQDFCKPTNLSITLSSTDLIEHTSLKCAPIVNDFAVIGYGLSYVAPKDMILVHSGTEYAKGNKAILGAGTGLGKSILRWIDEHDRYIPVTSEGGHADCAVQTQIELDFIDFIRQEEARDCNISWEDVLSGHGIQRMYHFFSDKNGISDGKNIPPDKIFARRHDDKRAWQTFELYTIFYARCAKNFALDSLCLGGFYVAGGIAAKNVQIFELPAFHQEFINCGKQVALLKNVPIWVIADYNVSLYGAAEYLILEKKCPF